MAYINAKGYVERKFSSGKKGTNSKSTGRDWWLIKYHGNQNSGYISIKGISLKNHLVGKKVRLKLEILEDETND